MKVVTDIPILSNVRAGHLTDVLTGLGSRVARGRGSLISPEVAGHGARVDEPPSTLPTLAVTRLLDNVERAPPGGTARAGSMATRGLDGGERAPLTGTQRLSHCRAGAVVTGCSTTVSVRHSVVQLGTGRGRRGYSMTASACH